MNNIERAEAYRDQLHDLANSYTAAEEREIDAVALELAIQKFDRMHKEELMIEWLERHTEDFRQQAIDELFSDQ